MADGMHWCYGYSSSGLPHGDGTVGIIRKVIIIGIYRIHRFVCTGMYVITIAIGRVSVAANGDLWDALVL